MISSQSFDEFLSKGFISGIEPGKSMSVLLNKFGNDSWFVKEIETNGLIYGIIKIGITEFHVYDEKIRGISYRPDLPYQVKDYQSKEIPWIVKETSVKLIEEQLKERGIKFTKYYARGPINSFQTAGVIVGLEKGEHVFIDTEGGVTFLFDYENKEVYQICKYYN